MKKWHPADDEEFDGEKITVYCSDLDWGKLEEG
ncbi:Protein of unknown function [Bacillus toyonensis]|nr:Protein of unknown function [Bacillus toyonensis]